MNNQKSLNVISPARASHLTLGLAGAVLASACSGYYPLGEAAQTEQPLGGDDAIGQTRVSDAHVAAALAPADVTIGTVYGAGPRTVAAVGDLDGDGRDEMAVVSSDFATGVSFVHLRYGGPRPRDAEEAFALGENGARLTLANGRANSLIVLGAGDVDGDGYGDLLVEASLCSHTQPGNGTYLVYGGSERLEGTLPLASVATHFLPVTFEDDPTGFTCGPVMGAVVPGDLDGDGFDDLVLASPPRYSLPGSATLNAGQPVLGTGEGVYVFYGRAQRLSAEVQLADADASLHITELVTPHSVGDVNGDGLADLLLAPNSHFQPDSSLSFLPGRATRWRGTTELEASTTRLEGASLDIQDADSVTDLDGDGLNEVLLMSQDQTLYLFYGAPGLFDDGLDFSQADATLLRTENTGRVYGVGDRDADGDDELLDQFALPDGPVQYYSSDVAFTSGSRERLSGSFSFPESEVIAQTPEGRFPGFPNRALQVALPAGDLDGDGAADLFTLSASYDFSDETSFQTAAHQLHIHYGTPTNVTALPR